MLTKSSLFHNGLLLNCFKSVFFRFVNKRFFDVEKPFLFFAENTKTVYFYSIISK